MLSLGQICMFSVWGHPIWHCSHSWSILLRKGSCGFTSFAGAPWDSFHCNSYTCCFKPLSPGPGSVNCRLVPFTGHWALGPYNSVICTIRWVIQKVQCICPTQVPHCWELFTGHVAKPFSGFLPLLHFYNVSELGKGGWLVPTLVM